MKMKTNWPFTRDFDKEEKVFALSKKSRWTVLDHLVGGHVRGHIDYESDSPEKLAHYVDNVGKGWVIRK